MKASPDPAFSVLNQEHTGSAEAFALIQSALAKAARPFSVNI
jgi:hypothetical protein